MGLDVSHDCWHGAHSAFMRWRCEVAKAAGMPPLLMMEGFYGHTEITGDDASAAVKALGFAKEHMWASDLLGVFYFDSNFPIKWECLKPSPLHILLNHSDCGGTIEPDDCAQIAQELEELLPKLPDGDGGGHIGNWREKTQAFIDGLRLAAHRGEPVEFI
jgi:hypothetical protein